MKKRQSKARCRKAMSLSFINDWSTWATIAHKKKERNVRLYLLHVTSMKRSASFFFISLQDGITLASLSSISVSRLSEKVMSMHNFTIVILLIELPLVSVSPVCYHFFPVATFPCSHKYPLHSSFSFSFFHHRPPCIAQEQVNSDSQSDRKGGSRLIVGD
jgi:hypothetical protein